MNKIFIILFLSFCNLFIFTNSGITEENKVRIGLLVPLTGDNAKIGKQILKATRLALKDIDSDKIEIFPKAKVSHINIIETKTLSANKSNNAPVLETRFLFRAIYPSKKSVTEAIIKVIIDNK